MFDGLFKTQTDSEKAYEDGRKGTSGSYVTEGEEKAHEEGAKAKIDADVTKEENEKTKEEDDE